MKKLLAFFGLSILLSAALTGCDSTENSDDSSLLDGLFGGSGEGEEISEEVLVDEEMPEVKGPDGPPSYYMNNAETTE